VTRRTIAATAAALLVGIVAISGCGGSGSGPTTTAANGEAGRPAQRVLADAKAAVRTATSVRIVMTHLPGELTGLDLALVAGKGGTGTLTLRGMQIGVVAVGTDTYVRAPAAYWSAMSGSATTARLLAGRWVKLPASTANGGTLGTVKDVADMQSFFATALTPTGTLRVRGVSSVNGTPVIQLADATGTASIALRGPAYPLAIHQTPAAGGGVALFEDWNAPVTIAPPPGAIEYTAAA
jgi:hypothetical protein